MAGPQALTLTAAAAPAAIAGIKSGANSNGANSAAYTFANGTPGALDTISNANLKVGVSTTSRLYAFLDTVFANQAALDAAVAALGIMSDGNGASVVRFVPDGTSTPANKPGATCTTAAATGSLRVSLAASIGA